MGEAKQNAEALRLEIIVLVKHIEKLEGVMIGMHEKINELIERVEQLEEGN